MKTGAVAPDVVKLNPGKLDKENLGLKLKNFGKDDMAAQSNIDGSTGDRGNLNEKEATSACKVKH